VLLDIDNGADRIGEFGIGMNPDLDCVTRNMALDEKMHGTVHFALGSAYEVCVGPENERNRSLLHMDMLVDLRKKGRLMVDGETILQDGEFIVT
jgi:aminopeptidase